MPSASFESVVDGWIYSLNTMLNRSDPRLHAHRSDNDAGNEHDPRITRASIHIDVLNSNVVPAMIGLICTSACGDDEYEDDILAQEVCEEQILRFGAARPFICFVANSTTRMTFYECRYVNDGHAKNDRRLPFAIDRAGFPSVLRKDVGQHSGVESMLMDMITANLTQAAERAIR